MEYNWQFSGREDYLIRPENEAILLDNLFFKVKTMKRDKPDNSTFYRILKVEEKASKESITSAYRRFAFRYHPDNDSNSRDSFDVVARAYQVLIDDVERRKYDIFLGRQRKKLKGDIPKDAALKYNPKTLKMVDSLKLFQSVVDELPSVQGRNGKNTFLSQQGQNLVYGGTRIEYEEKNVEMSPGAILEALNSGLKREIMAAIRSLILGSSQRQVDEELVKRGAIGILLDIMDDYLQSENSDYSAEELNLIKDVVILLYTSCHDSDGAKALVPRISLLMLKSFNNFCKLKLYNCVNVNHIQRMCDFGALRDEIVSFELSNSHSMIEMMCKVVEELAGDDVNHQYLETLSPAICVLDSIFGEKESLVAPFLERDGLSVLFILAENIVGVGSKPEVVYSLLNLIRTCIKLKQNFTFEEIFKSDSIIVTLFRFLDTSKVRLKIRIYELLEEIYQQVKDKSNQEKPHFESFKECIIYGFSVEEMGTSKFIDTLVFTHDDQKKIFYAAFELWKLHKDGVITELYLYGLIDNLCSLCDTEFQVKPILKYFCPSVATSLAAERRIRKLSELIPGYQDGKVRMTKFQLGLVYVCLGMKKLLQDCIGEAQIKMALVMLCELVKTKSRLFLQILDSATTLETLFKIIVDDHVGDRTLFIGLETVLQLCKSNLATEEIERGIVDSMVDLFNVHFFPFSLPILKDSFFKCLEISSVLSEKERTRNLIADNEIIYFVLRFSTFPERGVQREISCFLQKLLDDNNGGETFRYHLEGQMHLLKELFAFLSDRTTTAYGYINLLLFFTKVTKSEKIVKEMLKKEYFLKLMKIMLIIIESRKSSVHRGMVLALDNLFIETIMRVGNDREYVDLVLQNYDITLLLNIYSSLFSEIPSDFKKDEDLLNSTVNLCAGVCNYYFTNSVDNQEDLGKQGGGVCLSGLLLALVYYVYLTKLGQRRDVLSAAKLICLTKRYSHHGHFFNSLYLTLNHQDLAKLSKSLVDDFLQEKLSVMLRKTAGLMIEHAVVSLQLIAGDDYQKVGYAISEAIHEKIINYMKFQGIFKVGIPVSFALRMKYDLWEMFTYKIAKVLNSPSLEIFSDEKSAKKLREIIDIMANFNPVMYHSKKFFTTETENMASFFDLYTIVMIMQCRKNAIDLATERLLINFVLNLLHHRLENIDEGGLQNYFFNEISISLLILHQLIEVCDVQLLGCEDVKYVLYYTTSKNIHTSIMSVVLLSECIGRYHNIGEYLAADTNMEAMLMIALQNSLPDEDLREVMIDAICQLLLNMGTVDLVKPIRPLSTILEVLEEMLLKDGISERIKLKITYATLGYKKLMDQSEYQTGMPDNLNANNKMKFVSEILHESPSKSFNYQTSPRKNFDHNEFSLWKVEDVENNSASTKHVE